MNINVLSYTSLSPNPCKQSLRLPEGHTCLSKSALKSLGKLEEELNTLDFDPIPLTRDEEMLPTDGSKDAKMIRRLAAKLSVDSEYSLLQTDEVKNVMTPIDVKKEKERFKVHGPRLKNIGTSGRYHAYETMLKWAEVFDFFHPLQHAIYDGTETKNSLDVNKIMKIITTNYPDIRVLAADATIFMHNKDACVAHSIVILIDIRGDNFEDWSVEFFDASGYPPPDIIIPFLENMAKKLKEFRKKEGHKGNVVVAPVTAMLRHQFTTTECGMHSLIYIRRRLEGISYKMFAKYKIPDSFAREFRRDIFVT